MPRRRDCLEPAETEVGEDAIFADERHDVGDRSQRRQRGRFDEEVAELVADAIARRSPPGRCPTPA